VQVFLIRHADALQETLELRDPHRYLTAHGREQARALGDRLRWHDCNPAELWCSPLVRAVQTAELVLVGLGETPRVVAVPALAPGGNERQVLERLRALPAGSITVLVGHEPVLSGLAGALIGGADVPPLARAEAIRIDDLGSPARVRWRFAWNDAAPRGASEAVAAPHQRR
jgi:phosphohistidine phosphatase